MLTKEGNHGKATVLDLSSLQAEGLGVIIASQAQRVEGATCTNSGSSYVTSHMLHALHETVACYVMLLFTSAAKMYQVTTHDRYVPVMCGDSVLFGAPISTNHFLGNAERGLSLC